MKETPANILLIPQRLAQVRDRIAEAAAAAGREPKDIRLVGVTKSFPVEVVRAAIAAGITDIGENKVQEGRAKVAEIGREAATWHLIGHLQTNKARWAVRCFDLVHSVDSLRVAEAIQERAVQEETRVPVLLQVNTSGEESKFGVPPGELEGLVGRIAGLDHLTLRGLMTIAPLDEREIAVRPAFVRLRELFDQVTSWRIDGVEMTHLSMGMSHDLEWAVAEGATLVRVGSALFGSREG